MRNKDRSIAKLMNKKYPKLFRTVKQIPQITVYWARIKKNVHKIRVYLTAESILFDTMCFSGI
jgi:hypothetical protein